MGAGDRHDAPKPFDLGDWRHLLLVLRVRRWLHCPSSKVNGEGRRERRVLAWVIGGKQDVDAGAAALLESMMRLPPCSLASA